MSARTDVIDRIKLAPDAGLVASLGANHTLESALADLVDNSIDAEASHVLIRFVTRHSRLVQVDVVDDGRGMDDEGVTAAMTIGHRREYGDTELGHFGMGLKAASFGHADTLTVWSQKYGATPVGRRIRRADFSRDFTCEVLSPDAAESSEHLRRGLVGGQSGTLVVWDHLTSTYHGRSETEATSWLAGAENRVRTHLGVVFHRLLADERIRIDVMTADERDAGESIGIPVSPIDPFGYPRSGHPDYPKELTASVGGDSVSISCHVWPPKSDRTGFRIGQRVGEEFQGFFVYRHDRLLQIGGWSQAATRSTARQLARVVLDDPAAIGRFVTMNSEKQGLKFEPVFLEALSHARGTDGTTFEGYLADAEGTYAEAQKRQRRRKAAIKPDKGFAPALRRIIRDEIPMIAGETVKVQWKRLPEGEFLDVDFHSKTVWLNSYYRSLFAPERGSLNDAPVVKALVYLLTRHIFDGQYLGSKDRDDIALWQSVLGAAVEAEAEMRW